MTKRLYYTEPYRTSFDAVVVACAPAGPSFHVTLDQTAFYPTSGGQPFDVGELSGVPVTDVIDQDDGTVAHVVGGAIAVGTPVRGEIDWTRRFDHMQQHTGQHVLSAAFDRLCRARTASFHLGTASATIDLGREVAAADVARAEDEANRIVWEDRPVAIRFADAEEAAKLPLRKDPTRSGPLRLIAIDEFDLSACGGTHVSRTGAIGMIAIAGTEKFRGGTRVEFLCGGRALARFRSWRDAFAATQRVLSVAPAELAAGIERLQGDSKTLQRTIRSLQEELAGYQAKTLVSNAESIRDRLVFTKAMEGWDAVGLKALAAAAVAEEPRLALALITTSSPALVVVARGKDAAIDAGAVLKQLVARFGGRGGGKPDLAQGGGLTGGSTEIVQFARDILAGG